jgi:hypothetical protein
MPTISSASVRLATTATDTVAPPTSSTPLLLFRPEDRSWQHGRTWTARRTVEHLGRNRQPVPATPLMPLLQDAPP